MPIRDGNLKASIQIDNKSAMREVRNSNREVVRMGGTARAASSQIRRVKKLATQIIEDNTRIRKRAVRQIEAAERRSATFGLRGIAPLLLPVDDILPWDVRRFHTVEIFGPT